MLAMKVFDAGDTAAAKSFVNELKAYDVLSELQGRSIPVLHSFGRMAHTGCPAIVMQWAGCSIKRHDNLSIRLLETAKQGLQAMHKMHVSHGDVCLGNILIHKDRILFCDLGSSSINAPPDACEQDLTMLDAVVSDAHKD